jgi:hypothetical protein
MMKKLERNETISLFKNYMDTNAFSSSSNLLSVESLENINSLSKEYNDINKVDANDKKEYDYITKKEEYKKSSLYQARDRSRERSYSKDRHYRERERDDRHYRDDKYYRNDKYYKDDKFHRDRLRERNDYGYNKDKYSYSDNKKNTYSNSRANDNNRSERKYH